MNDLQALIQEMEGAIQNEKSWLKWLNGCCDHKNALMGGKKSRDAWFATVVKVLNISYPENPHALSALISSYTNTRSVYGEDPSNKDMLHRALFMPLHFSSSTAPLSREEEVETVESAGNLKLWSSILRRAMESNEGDKFKPFMDECGNYYSNFWKDASAYFTLVRRGKTRSLNLKQVKTMGECFGEAGLHDRFVWWKPAQKWLQDFLKHGDMDRLEILDHLWAFCDISQRIKTIEGALTAQLTDDTGKNINKDWATRLLTFTRQYPQDEILLRLGYPCWSLLLSVSKESADVLISETQELRKKCVWFEWSHVECHFSGANLLFALNASPDVQDVSVLERLVNEGVDLRTMRRDNHQTPFTSDLASVDFLFHTAKSNGMASALLASESPRSSSSRPAPHEKIGASIEKRKERMLWMLRVGGYNPHATRAPLLTSSNTVPSHKRDLDYAIEGLTCPELTIPWAEKHLGLTFINPIPAAQGYDAAGYMHIRLLEKEAGALSMDAAAVRKVAKSASADSASPKKSMRRT